MTLVFWQNILSPHQVPFLRCLAELGHEVTVITITSMTADRAALGWKAPNVGCAHVIIDPEAAEIQRLIKSSPKASIHVMAGARWYPLGNQAVKHCIESKRRLGIISEAPDSRGILVYGRWIKYAVERFSIGFRYNFVLAMGEMGVRWFRRSGYLARTVFPFAYVTEPVSGLQVTPRPSFLSVLFVGRLVKLKGVDLLLRAFAAVSPPGAKLKMIGTGPEDGCLRHLASELHVADSVIWAGNMKNSMVSAAMASADVMVLPSRKDGWGAVVNEALMVGTPVICSSACGAAELIREPWRGTVFRSGSVGDLAKALNYWIDLARRSQVERERIRSWTTCISGQAVAEYFAAILDHVYGDTPRPVAPWRASWQTS